MKSVSKFLGTALAVAVVLAPSHVLGLRFTGFAGDGRIVVGRIQQVGAEEITLQVGKTRVSFPGKGMYRPWRGKFP